jgi:very-short-patch-repair endonuclease
MREKGLPRPTKPAHGPLADLAKQQHGIVSIRQLLGPLGYSESAVGRAAATGRLHRLYRGVYAVGHTDISSYSRCLAVSIAWSGSSSAPKSSVGRAIALYRTPAFNRSSVERHLLALMREAGLPRPSTGFNECGYELDVYWPEERFAVEFDVFETHGTRGAFERDRLRQEDLKLAGIEMTRVTGRRLEREPQQVVERIARLLEQRRLGRA